MSFRVGFCVSGQGRLFRSFLAEAPRLGASPALLVLEHKADPALDDLCAMSGVACRRLPRARGEAFARALEEALAGVHLDLICLTFDRLLPPAVVRRWRGKVVNLHMSLLPAFPGMRALEQALAGGARFAGASVHEVDEGVDTGPLIAQCVVGVDRGQSLAALGDAVYRHARPMVLQTIAWYAQGRVQRDASGGLWVEGATYGGLPISPALEPPLA